MKIEGESCGCMNSATNRMNTKERQLEVTTVQTWKKSYEENGLLKMNGSQGQPATCPSRRLTNEKKKHERRKANGERRETTYRKWPYYILILRPSYSNLAADVNS